MNSFPSGGCLFACGGCKNHDGRSNIYNEGNNNLSGFDKKKMDETIPQKGKESTLMIRMAIYKICIYLHYLCSKNVISVQFKMK
jgi:hypothetical protein